MGKLRRERQKYHLLGVKSTNDASANVTENDEASKKQLQETSTVLSVPENLFAGIDISPDNLKQSVKDPDIRSVISKKSLSAGSVISKKEKRKLRHEAFLKKLEATYQMRKDAKRKKKFKKTPFKVETPSQLDNLPSSSLPDELPSLDLNTRLAQKSSSSKKKQRGVPKEKFRKKIMLQDIDLFKRLLADDKYKADPVTSVSSYVHSKVYEELMDDS